MKLPPLYLAVCLIIYSVSSFAAPLSSVVSSSGGTVELDGGTWEGGVFIENGATLVLNGSGATINLQGGNLGFGSNSNATLRNMTIQNGVGILSGQGMTLTLENVSFNSVNYSVLSSVGSNITLRNCRIQNCSEFALNGNNGNITLEDVTVENGKSFAFYNGAQVTIDNVEVKAGEGNGIDFFNSGAPASIQGSGLIVRNRIYGLSGGNMGFCNISNFNMVDCKRGFILNSVTTVNLNSGMISGSGFGAISDSDGREEGVNLTNVQNASITGATVFLMRSGLVALDCVNVVTENSELFSNRLNQINYYNVQSGLIKGCLLESAPVRGAINVQDFDAIFLFGSNVLIEDSKILDGADNCILANRSTVTVDRCFIAGGRTAGVSGRKDDDAPPGSEGSVMGVYNSTILNCYQQAINIDETSSLVAFGNIVGNTNDLTAFPAHGTNPPGEAFRGTTFQALSADFTFDQTYMHRPLEYGFQVFNTQNKPTGVLSYMRHNTMQGVGGVTIEGALFVNAGFSNVFSDNHLFGVTGFQKRTVLVDGSTGVADMRRNWLGNPGDEGFNHPASGFTNADNCYFGSGDGPSGLFGGSGSSVTGNQSGFTVTPFLTAPPMETAITSLNVPADGSTVATSFGTSRVSTRIFYQGEAPRNPETGATAGYEALMTLTSYTDVSAPLVSNPSGLGANEVRRFLNLWLDARLWLYGQSGNFMSLDLAIPGMTNPINGARIEWRDRDGNLQMKTAGTLLDEGSVKYARFDFTAGEEFPSSALAFTVSEGEPPVENVPYNTEFNGGTDSWTNSNFGVPGTTAVGFSRTANSIRFSGNGSAEDAGAWSSPFVNVEGGKTYSVKFQVASDTARSLCPTVRLRISEEFFRHSLVRNIESTQGGENSPGEDIVEYEVIYEAPSYVSRVKLSVDLLSFSNLDNTSANIDIFNVNMVERSGTLVPATELYTTSFVEGAEGWTNSPFGIPGSTPPVFGVGGGNIRVTANGSSASAGAWSSPLIDVSGGTTVLITWSLRSSSAPENTPTIRLRIGEEFFRDSFLLNAESTLGGENSPGTAVKTYQQVYNVPSFVTNLRLNMDLLSFNPADDTNASIEVLDVKVEEVN